MFSQKGVINVAKNDSKSGSVNFFQQIVFQNFAINIVMLILFIVAIATMTRSVKTLISTAVVASTNESDLLINEAKMRQDVIAIDGALSALLGATQTGTATDENLEVYYGVISAAEAEIPGLEQYLSESILVTQHQD